MSACYWALLSGSSCFTLTVLRRRRRRRWWCVLQNWQRWPRLLGSKHGWVADPIKHAPLSPWISSNRTVTATKDVMCVACGNDSVDEFWQNVWKVGCLAMTGNHWLDFGVEPDQYVDTHSLTAAPDQRGP